TSESGQTTHIVNPKRREARILWFASYVCTHLEIFNFHSAQNLADESTLWSTQFLYIHRNFGSFYVRGHKSYQEHCKFFHIHPPNAAWATRGRIRSSVPSHY